MKRQRVDRPVDALADYIELPFKASVRVRMTSQGLDVADEDLPDYGLAAFRGLADG